MYYMGQYRSNSSDTYLENFPSKSMEHIKIDNKYKDVIVKFGENSFNPNESYLLSLDLVKNAVFDTSYNIKMVQVIEDKVNTDSYELIKTISLDKDENLGVDNYTTVIVEENGNDILVKKYNGETPSHNNYNIVKVPHSWEAREMDDNNSYHFDIVFSSRYTKSSFNAILIEIVRTPDDEDIINGENWYGRYLDLSEGTPDIVVSVQTINTSLLSLGDIVIKKIGVWGRSELPLVINGEEIQIGPSGCFELEGYDINSFGVCANADDKFIVDYQYVKKEEGR